MEGHRFGPNSGQSGVAMAVFFAKFFANVLQAYLLATAGSGGGQLSLDPPALRPVCGVWKYFGRGAGVVRWE